MIPGFRLISAGFLPSSSRRALCSNTTREIVPPPLQPASPDHGKVTNTGKAFVGLTFICAVWLTKRYLDGKFEPIPGVHTPLVFDKEGDLVIPELDAKAFPETVVIPGGFKQNRYQSESDSEIETK